MRRTTAAGAPSSRAFPRVSCQASSSVPISSLIVSISSMRAASAPLEADRPVAVVFHRSLNRSRVLTAGWASSAARVARSDFPTASVCWASSASIDSTSGCVARVAPIERILSAVRTAWDSTSASGIAVTTAGAGVAEVAGAPSPAAALLPSWACAGYVASTVRRMAARSRRGLMAGSSSVARY